MASDTHTSQSWEKGTLLVGFASLAVAVLLARGSPPETYELSTYTGTPLGFWAGAGMALLVAVFVGLRARGGVRRLALFLGGTAMLAVASLPLLRSYYYYGAGDSLTHLAWAKDIAAGKLSVLNLLYPGTHSIAVFLSDLTGMGLNRAILVMVMAFVATFLLFVPLATWAITHDRRATTLAAFSGFLLLPLNNVSVFDMAHPTSQAIMFAPLLFYLVARYLTRADRDTMLVGSPTGLLLAVASVAVVLVHPQQAANVLVVFTAIFGLQILARLLGWRASEHRTLALQTVFLAGVFLLWAPRHERATGATSALINMVLDGPQVAADVSQRSTSLAALGGSIEMLFVKLFLVSLVFCALAGVLVLAGLLGRYDDSLDAATFVRYFGLALVPLGVLFGAYFFVSYERLHFRQLGFIMVPVTILGAIALSRGVEGLSTRFSRGSAHAVVGVVVLVMLALSIPSIYPSPYMYKSSNHVTEAHIDGYATAIEHRDSTPFIGIRGSGDRYIDAVLGYEESEKHNMAYGGLYGNEDHPATDENFRGSYVAEHYDDRYLAFTDRTYQRDVEVYNEFRFDRTGFRSLDSTPGLNRVQANGGFQMYLINRTNEGG
jgi:hypothetical protein